LGDLAYAANVFIAFGLAVAQVSAEMFPKLIGVEHLYWIASISQLRLECAAERSFSSSAQAGKPDCQTTIRGCRPLHRPLLLRRI
jgi:hypothetical protein